MIIKNFIRTNKPANPRIVIPGLKVVKPRFLIIDIAPVPEGVLLAEGVGQGTGVGEGIAPGIVDIFDAREAGSCQNITIKEKIRPRRGGENIENLALKKCFQFP